MPSGDIEFLGREDTQVKVQGFRIELGEIEVALERHPQVNTAVVVATGERASPKHLAAYVVADGVSADELTAYIRQKLPSYMVPTVWQMLDALPLSANGKVNRNALPIARVSAPGAGVITLADGSDALARVSALICEELGYPSLEPNKDLLSFGATSLDLVRIVGRFEKEFGFRPSFQDFFRDTTAAALARLIEQHGSSKGGAMTGRPQAPGPRRRALELIIDPEARDAFHHENRGIRVFPEGWGTLPLEQGTTFDNGFRHRRAVRRFLPEQVPLAAIGNWLAELRRTNGHTVKYAYASAGGCYPVQTYLHAKHDGIAGCPGGTFYYDPVKHGLVPLTVGASWTPASTSRSRTGRPSSRRASRCFS